MKGLPEAAHIYCADIGSLKKFAWVCADARDQEIAAVDSISGPLDVSTIDHLAHCLSTDLALGLPVALGLECPLYIPVPELSQNMLKARDKREGNRAAFAGAGPGAALAGLQELAYLFKNGIPSSTDVSFDPFEWCEKGKGLLIWEAFVSGAAHTTDGNDLEDARSGLRAFMKVALKASERTDWNDSWWSQGQSTFSLAAAALIWCRQESGLPFSSPAELLGALRAAPHVFKA